MIARPVCERLSDPCVRRFRSSDGLGGVVADSPASMLHLPDSRSGPALGNRQDDERSRIPSRAKPQVPGSNSAHKPQDNPYASQDHRVPHWAIGCETCSEVGTSDADDDAISGRKQGLGVVDRLVHGRENLNHVQHNIDDGGDDDNREKPRDDRPDTFFVFVFMI